MLLLLSTCTYYPQTARSLAHTYFHPMYFPYRSNLGIDDLYFSLENVETISNHIMSLYAAKMIAYTKSTSEPLVVDLGEVGSAVGVGVSGVGGIAGTGAGASVGTTSASTAPTVPAAPAIIPATAAIDACNPASQSAASFSINLDQESESRAVYIHNSRPGVSMTAGPNYERRIDEIYLNKSLPGSTCYRLVSRKSERKILHGY